MDNIIVYLLITQYEYEAFWNTQLYQIYKSSTCARGKHIPRCTFKTNLL
jgi:hypothetical protein